MVPCWVHCPETLVRIQPTATVCVAQLAEQRFVVPPVVGFESHHAHFRHKQQFYFQTELLIWIMNKCLVLLGCRQVVRHGVLIPAFTGSNPVTSVKYTVGNRILKYNMVECRG